MQTIKCFHKWKLVAIQKKTFYVLAMTLMFSIYDHCMDCMISYNCMALLWKPCFQVWPFYGNHVFKYDPLMETMFSSTVILWIPCFLSMALSWKSCFFLKYGTFMKPALLLLSSQKTSHIRTHNFF